jgi:hypothetical protein
MEKVLFGYFVKPELLILTTETSIPLRSVGQKESYFIRAFFYASKKPSKMLFW